MGLTKCPLILNDEADDFMIREFPRVIICMSTIDNCYECGERVSLFFGEPTKFVYINDTYDDAEYVKCDKCGLVTLYLLDSLRCDEPPFW